MRATITAFCPPAPEQVHAGDKLHFTCHVEATAERAAVVKAPLPPAPLVFGNHAFTAEMCILYGYLIGPGFDGGYTLN